MRYISRVNAALLVVLVASAGLFAQERSELLASPKIDTDAKQPSFVDLTAEQVEQAITVRSARNYAMFGFNTPEIRLLLPETDNSVYAVFEFAEPTVVDASGAPVAFTIERGIYDHDVHADEIRLTSASGEEPISFAEASGTVSVRYPLRIRTLTARAGEPSPPGLMVTFDGPFLTVQKDGDGEELDAAPFTGIEPFRVYNASGQQLEAYPHSSYKSINGVVTETTSYWGEVAEVQQDVVEEWVEVEVRYALPPAEPIPSSRAGLTPAEGTERTAGATGTVTTSVVVATPARAAARELGVTPDEARQRLRQLGYTDPNERYFVMAATQGQLEAVKLFLATGVPIDVVPDDSTALISAVRFRHPDVALYLVEQGADVTILDSNNCSALLHAAGICDFAEVVRALLDAGADPAPLSAGGIDAAKMAEIMSCRENQELIAAASGS